MATTFTEEQLNQCSKEMLVQLFLSMQEQMGQLSMNDYFNEAEAIAAQGSAVEPEMEEIPPTPINAVCRKESVRKT